MVWCGTVRYPLAGNKSTYVNISASGRLRELLFSFVVCVTARNCRTVYVDLLSVVFTPDKTGRYTAARIGSHPAAAGRHHTTSRPTTVLHHPASATVKTRSHFTLAARLLTLK